MARQQSMSRAPSGLTLLEVMVVLAVVGVLVTLVAPSMHEMIGMQRLRGVATQLVTDLQFARSEAIARNQVLGFTVRNNAAESSTCYVLFGGSDPQYINSADVAACNCANPIGNVCGGASAEIRTVQIPRADDLTLKVPASIRTTSYKPLQGGIVPVPSGVTTLPAWDFCVEVARTPRGRLRVIVSPSGQPSVCTPDSSVTGFDACPATSSNPTNCASIPP